MPYHFESGVGPNHKYYIEGAAAGLKNEPRKAPFKDQQSPEAMAWFKGYDDIKIGGKERLKEIDKLEKWYNL